ncbi:choloylglycine hydrolase [Alloiococcus sp. CFN-8]|uniref:choloylglycine hydrolase n=1 Tax=Alloiococcus sp. CFN-8 TaxID=3416081 RepID=UPI003CF82701
MCTALTLMSQDGYHFFGRNMDIEYNFNQSVILVPRKYQWENVITKEMQSIKYAILGMGTVINNHPLLADGFNEKGLACAGLNFPDYCYHSPEPHEGKTNIGPYDFMLWMLSNFETVSEVRSALTNINLVNIPFAPGVGIATLHWIVYDKKDDCIVIEQTRDKFSVFDNKIGVLTNPPTFDWHIENLNQYITLSSHWVDDTEWYNQKLSPFGGGLGLHGMPGDSYPPSRFVRAAFFKSHSRFTQDEASTFTEFFHILYNAAVPSGAIIKKQDKDSVTIYTSCMSLERGVYYYTTYKNLQINAVDLFKEDLDGDQLKTFEYIDTPKVHIQN